MSTLLKGETHRYQVLRQRLLATWPEIDCDTLTDTLEGITDLHEMIAAVIRSALVDEALHAGLRTRLADMKERLSRLEERGAKKRQLALDAMDEVGLAKLQQPELNSVDAPRSPCLVIMAEDAIPSPYWVPQPPKIDRPGLLGELKRGGEIPGVQLSNPKPIFVREDKVMEFSDEQVRQLKSKLDGKYVKMRHANGAALHHVEGWHTIAEANRIFGFDAWDRRTISSTCVHSESSRRDHVAAYIAKVRVRVRAGKITIVREGSGMGEGTAITPGKAHELALKGAETDATKRALATFGSSFESWTSTTESRPASASHGMIGPLQTDAI